MHINIVVTAGQSHKFSYVSKSGEVHYCVDPMGRKYRIQCCGVPNIPFDQIPPANKLPMTE